MSAGDTMTSLTIVEGVGGARSVLSRMAVPSKQAKLIRTNEARLPLDGGSLNARQGMPCLHITHLYAAFTEVLKNEKQKS
jgi:hypothetical protein